MFRFLELCIYTNACHTTPGSSAISSLFREIYQSDSIKERNKPWSTRSIAGRQQHQKRSKSKMQLQMGAIIPFPGTVIFIQTDKGQIKSQQKQMLPLLGQNSCTAMSAKRLFCIIWQIFQMQIKFASTIHRHISYRCHSQHQQSLLPVNKTF